jgi:hypothetical protein
MLPVVLGRSQAGRFHRSNRDTERARQGFMCFELRVAVSPSPAPSPLLAPWKGAKILTDYAGCRLASADAEAGQRSQWDKNDVESGRRANGRRSHSPASQVRALQELLRRAAEVEAAANSDDLARDDQARANENESAAGVQRNAPVKRARHGRFYTTRGRCVCDLCNHRMQASHQKGTSYMRCLWASAVAAKATGHPASLQIKEQIVVGEAVDFLATRVFAPDALARLMTTFFSWTRVPRTTWRQRWTL